MPISTVIKLFPQEDTILPPTMGQYGHAVFFEILKQSDPNIAERVHNMTDVKPFTVSPLQSEFKKLGKGQVLITAGTECWMRYTLLDDTLFPVFSRYFLTVQRPTIRLARGVFELTELLTSQNIEETKWSGHASYGELMEQAKTNTIIDLRFYSPTAFRRRDPKGGKSQNFPGVDMMGCYQSWVNKWNVFAPLKIDKDMLLAFVYNHGGLTLIEARTRMMDFGKHKQVGFVGNSQFQFREDWGCDFDDEEIDYLPSPSLTLPAGIPPPPPLPSPHAGREEGGLRGGEGRGGGTEKGMKGGESWTASEPSPYPPSQPGPMAEEMLKQVNLLADFAFYAGTGLKATMGMGQTRRLG